MGDPQSAEPARQLRTHDSIFWVLDACALREAWVPSSGRDEVFDKLKKLANCYSPAQDVEVARRVIKDFGLKRKKVFL